MKGCEKEDDSKSELALVMKLDDFNILKGDGEDWLFVFHDGISRSASMNTNPSAFLTLLDYDIKKLISRMEFNLKEDALEKNLFPFKELVHWVMVEYRNTFWARKCIKWLKFYLEEDIVFYEKIVEDAKKSWPPGYFLKMLNDELG